MLVCVFVCYFCTRDRGCSAHPVFPAPSFFLGANEFAKLGRSVSRECGGMSRTINAKTKSASSRHRPGPITPGVGCEGRHPPHCRNENARRMGPGARPGRRGIAFMQTVIASASECSPDERRDIRGCSYDKVPHVAALMRATITKHNSAFSRHTAPEVCKFVALEKRAQGRPGARCTRGLACKSK